MATNIDALVPKLQQRLAALGNGGDATSDNAKATYRRTCDGIQRTIIGLMNDPHDLAREQARLAECEEPRAAVLRRQAELEQQIADAPDVAVIRDGRERDKEYDRQQHLKRQLQLLREGRLLLAPGVVYARLSDLDARIAELQQRIAKLRSALDSHVQTAQALLAEPVTV